MAQITVTLFSVSDGKYPVSLLCLLVPFMAYPTSVYKYLCIVLRSMLEQIPTPIFLNHYVLQLNPQQILPMDSLSGARGLPVQKPVVQMYCACVNDPVLTRAVRAALAPHQKLNRVFFQNVLMISL